MQFSTPKFVLISALAVVFSTAISAAQRNDKANPSLPAAPPAKSSQPATHFTQGTITSIEANQIVITRKVRGKAEQVTFSINSQTERTGNLVPGTRVSVQYREADHRNIAAAVREMPVEATVKPGKKPGSKS
jgi:hypothetical protein